ncbi:hypothetical protein JOQ06_027524 [Pogonophryne albipinna]|uniref:Uncharacterized protein n=1 Tax=Pogonophryne albipinna TaxID=1090488 RepID=A0AAD6BD22_9TELE|nr:hypothetical protein JOQ06_027524 [Pogonophryne albipinna]
MKIFHNTARQKLIPPVIHHAQPSGRSTDLIAGRGWICLNQPLAGSEDFFSSFTPPTEGRWVEVQPGRRAAESLDPTPWLCQPRVQAALCKASGTPATPSSTHLHLFHHIPSSSLDWLNRSVQGEDIGIQIGGCYYEQMSPLASKGNGTSRPTLTPGAKQHTTTGLPRGQRAGGTASTSTLPTQVS